MTNNQVIHGRAVGQLGERIHIQCRGCHIWFSFQEDELPESDYNCAFCGWELVTIEDEEWEELF